MKYFEDFLRLGVLSKDQANKVVGNSNAAKKYMRNALREGLTEKVKHNYCVVKSIETKQVIPSRFAIGSHVNPSAFISHHSAFEYYGMANQVLNEVTVSSEKKFKPFSFDGIDYRYLATQFFLALSLIRILSK